MPPAFQEAFQPAEGATLPFSKGKKGEAAFFAFHACLFLIWMRKI
ncbi:hypothetical protein WCP94_000032 (plasmid) [Bilophila wadsworthia]